MEARRPLVFCKHCGKGWKVQPCHTHAHVYCSKECRKAESVQREYPCPVCGVMKMRYLSGAEICMPCSRKIQGRTMKALGNNPRKYQTAEGEKRRLEKIRSKENRERTSILHKGKDKHTPKTKRFSKEHARAASGIFLNPQNQRFPFRNICKFVFENKHLFNDEDTIQKTYKGIQVKSYQCNATHGLSAIYAGRRNSWKGWRMHEKD